MICVSATPYELRSPLLLPQPSSPSFTEFRQLGHNAMCTPHHTTCTRSRTNRKKRARQSHNVALSPAYVSEIWDYLPGKYTLRLAAPPPCAMNCSTARQNTSARLVLTRYTPLARSRTEDGMTRLIRVQLQRRSRRRHLLSPKAPEEQDVNHTKSNTMDKGSRRRVLDLGVHGASAVSSAFHDPCLQVAARKLKHSFWQLLRLNIFRRKHLPGTRYVGRAHGPKANKMDTLLNIERARWCI